MRGPRVGARKRREHALIFGAAIGGAEREPVEIVRRGCLAVEILHQPPLPGRRQIERRDQRGEQSDIAHADVGRRQAVLRGGFEPERQHLGIGRRDVAAAERFDAGLQEFAGAVAAVAEHRARDSRSPARCRLRRGQIVARDRDGEIGPQAEIVPGRIGGQVHARADVFAGEVEERLRRLQEGGRGARIAGRAHRTRPALRACVLANRSPGLFMALFVVVMARAARVSRRGL